MSYFHFYIHQPPDHKPAMISVSSKGLSWKSAGKLKGRRMKEKGERKKGKGETEDSKQHAEYSKQETEYSAQ